MDLLAYFQHARQKLLLPPGRLLFSEGEAGTVMYVLLQGTASVLVRGTAIELAAPGQILGEMALIDESPRSATVLTRTECHLVSIGRAEFDLLIRETPAFGRHVMGVMASRLRRMNERLEQVYHTRLA